MESKLYIYRLSSRIRVRMSQVWRWLELFGRLVLDTIWPSPFTGVECSNTRSRLSLAGADALVSLNIH